MSVLKIYTVTHKKFTPPDDKIYVPIQVGKQFSGLDLGYISDDTGNNIAQKNKNYCELTALYWIWKNDDSDIVGLCHYRRFFTRKKTSTHSRFFLNEKQIREILETHQAIIPRKTKLDDTVEQKYIRSPQNREDYQKLRKVIQNQCPEYLNAFNQVSESRSACFCNMLITKKYLLDQYCQWLFNILESLEKEIDLSGYSANEARIYGYLAERLLNVWLLHNKIITKEVPIVNTDLQFRHRVKIMYLSIWKQIKKWLHI